ncbi:unnamed protein product, partial [Nesidiocoris tenuis]
MWSSLNKYATKKLKNAGTIDIFFYFKWSQGLPREKFYFQLTNWNFSFRWIFALG